MAKGFAAPAGGAANRALLDGEKGEWNVTSSSDLENYFFGHDENGLFVERIGETDGNIAVTMQYAASVNLSRTAALVVEGSYGTAVPNNPPMELVITVRTADGGHASAVLVSCAGNTAEAVPSKTFSRFLDVSELTGFATVTLHFTVGQYYANPSFIRVNKIQRVTGSIPGTGKTETELSVTLNKNGVHTIDAPTGIVYNRVVATVDVESDITILENQEVTLDFSNGDIEVDFGESIALRSGVILKPESLIPENIVEDVEIAGIVGTHKAFEELPTAEGVSF